MSIIQLFRTLRVKIIHRLLNIEIQPGLYNICSSTKIYGKNEGHIHLGKRTITSKNVVLVANGGEIYVGDNCSFSGNSTFVAHDKIVIGDNCKMGPGVKVYDHDHLFNETGVLPEGHKTAPIIIGKNSWIGANAILLRGTNIGEGCVVGAGTIVKGIIPPHSIVTNDRELIIHSIDATK